MTTRFRGLPVSAGRASGTLRVTDNSNKRGSAKPAGVLPLDETPPGEAPSGPPPRDATPRDATPLGAAPGTSRPGAVQAEATPEAVTAAFAEVHARRSALAARLRADGRDEEAGIIEVGALIAADPALSAPAAEAVRAGAAPAAAITEAAERQARLMGNLDNPALAARASDIRDVAAAALDNLRTDSARTDNGDSPAPADDSPGAPFILVRPDVSPAELIELESVLAGAVSVAGGASSHAAIIARGLGLPMIAGTDPAVLGAASGQPAFLDADAGELVVGETAREPGPAGGEEPRFAGARIPAGPVTTADGVEITVLCNVASASETRRGLAAGAEGVGLLRTEIGFLESPDWPGRQRQRDHLEPILVQLPGRPAVVRLLDFSGDKIPPFLPRDLPPGAGLAALLDHPTALSDHLRAILDAGRGTRLSILIPMVRDPAEIERVRDALARAADALDLPVPPVGIMVELAATAARADEFARSADFFSIGTNDLAGDVLGLARDDPAAGPGRAADPRVLALVRRVARAGKRAGIGVSVCGDAAADPLVLPKLLAEGIRAVSVAAGAVAGIRSGIKGLTVL